MSLSARFEKMEANRAIVKPVFNNGISQRRSETDSRRKVGRQIQFDSRRQGVANAKPAMRAAQSKVVSPRQQTAPQRVQGRGRGRSTQAGGGRNQRSGGMPVRNNNNNNNQRTGGRGGGGGASTGRGAGRGAERTGGRGGGRGGRGAGRGGRGNANSRAGKKAAKETDLDEGLDEYWFKAGKGPDPKVASLDRGLDSYWSKATDKTNGDAAAGDKMEDTDAPAPVVVAPVAGVDPDL
ncbi:unnamed protein product [Ectocarpus sp. 8 AP-2014]